MITSESSRSPNCIMESSLNTIPSEDSFRYERREFGRGRMLLKCSSLSDDDDILEDGERALIKNIKKYFIKNHITKR